MSSFFRMHITTYLDGLHAALVNLRIGELWIGRDEEIPAFKSLVEEVHSRGIRVVNKEGGAQFINGEVKDEVLWPPDMQPEDKTSNVLRHPAQAVIERYENRGVQLLRTDRDGAITAVTDGRSLFVHRYNDP